MNLIAPFNSLLKQNSDTQKISFPKINLEAKIIRLNSKDNQKAGQFCEKIYCDMGWSKKYAYGFDDLKKTFGGKKEIFLIAKSGEAVVGCVGLKDLSKKEGLIKRFYIHYEFRGAGLANLLLARLIKFAKQKSYRFLVLDTYKNNHRAQKFYTKNGFVDFSPDLNEKWPESANPKLYQYFRIKI